VTSKQEAAWVLRAQFGERLLVLLIFRMTHKILQAIEVAAR
jgi:hypothetical protein